MWIWRPPDNPSISRSFLQQNSFSYCNIKKYYFVQKELIQWCQKMKQKMCQKINEYVAVKFIKNNILNIFLVRLSSQIHFSKN